MKASDSSRVVTKAETDQEMLGWLRSQLSSFSEDGYKRRYADTIIARFAELIENQEMFKRAVETLEGAHKLAMAQVQFAQSVVRQLEQRTVLAVPEKIDKRNGKSVAPELDLQGK